MILIIVYSAVFSTLIAPLQDFSCHFFTIFLFHTWSCFNQPSCSTGSHSYYGLLSADR